jgi:hypothetical protein
MEETNKNKPEASTEQSVEPSQEKNTASAEAPAEKATENLTDKASEKTETSGQEQTKAPSAEKHKEEIPAKENPTEENNPKPAEATTASDADLETEDDTQEVEGDDEHEAHPDALELPNYANYPAEKLVEEANWLLGNEPIQKIKDHFEAIRKELMQKLNAEKEEKLAAFKEQGGNEINFEYLQPLRESFKKTYGKYRQQRKKYYQELREKLDENLKTKQDLIEQLKNLISKEESIGKTFKEFNAIQQAWRETGPVPRANSHNLWQTWHHHVHNFYEYIDINKELRDLDYQKNQEDKELLITKAKELLEWKDQPKAFKVLQELHKEWKHIGPVAPDLRESLWETFSGLTKELRKKQDAYYDELRALRGKLVETKQELVDKILAVPVNWKKHNEWQKAMKEVRAYSEKFKKIGRLHHPDNDQVWQAYREAIRHFNHQKNEFYKGQKKEHQANLEKKKALVEQAEKLKDSEEWRETANTLKKIQADWKKIGHVPKKESDRVWKEFKAACNHFFNRLTENNKNRDKEFTAHLEQKQNLLKEIQAFKPDANQPKEAAAKLKEYIGKWRKIGPVPRGKGKIEKQFNEVLDTHFDAINLNREEAQRIRFENKMKSMSEQGGAKKLKYERKELRQNLESAQKELGQLETNMSFFNSSDPNSPIVKEAQKKIKRQKEQIEKLQAQMKMLNVEIRQQENAASTEKEAQPSDTKSKDE